MKHIFLAFCILTCAVLGQQPSPGILRYPMDENAVRTIPCVPGQTTTISFPYAIQVLDGAGFTPDPANIRGDFLLSFTPGNKVFSVSPMSAAANRNINAIVQGRVYVFEFVPASPASPAAKSVIMDPPNPYGSSGGQVVKTDRPPKRQLKSAGGARLIGLLDRMKLVTALPDEGQVRQAVAQMPSTTLALRNDEPVDYGTHSIRLRKVMRDNRLDALVFEIELTNQTDQTINFDVESLSVRVGDKNVYTQVITDLDPVIGPGKTALGWFGIIGTADGRPNYLDVSNNFKVSAAILTGGPARKDVEKPLVQPDDYSQESVDQENPLPDEKDVARETAKVSPPLVEVAPPTVVAEEVGSEVQQHVAEEVDVELKVPSTVRKQSAGTKMR